METKRLILRSWTLDDIDQLYELAKDEHVGPDCGWNPHKSKEESQFVLEKILMVPQTYAIVLKETHQVIGNISLFHGKDCENEHQKEVGFWLGYPYWGKGYMPEACLKLMSYAFEILQCEKLWCIHDINNHNSKRVQEKCHFKFQYQDNHHYLEQLNKTTVSIVNGLTKEEWEQL